MEAIISRPKAGAKQSPARQQAKHSDPVPARPTEAERLQTEALQILHYLCTELAQAELQDMPHALAEAIECDTVLFNLLNPEESDSPQIGTLESLVMLRQQVQNTFACLEAASGPTVPVAIASAALLEHIDGFAAQLHPAIAGLPGTLEDLRALTTFAGIKTFRDRPTPPIRRVEPADHPKSVPAAQAGRAGQMLALQCTWDIEGVAEEIAKIADRIDDYGTLTAEALLRCYALRIIVLNGQLMSFLDGDNTTMGDMHWKIFRGTRPFEGGQ
ncbi:hypothetical protein [Comamonas sp.]|uniref:hypothetical protein n=1 Tax=Comamonas sp. TaxID=34028 RepID=UPI00289B0BC6|nr:hypothetical protein [Comamonas sp.]